MATVETYALPTWLYRFRSLSGRGQKSGLNETKLERELEAIEQGYVYCATYRDMNDPMEGFYRTSGLLRTKEGYDEFSRSVLTDKLSLGIASFTESWRNEIMWAHYADGFQGICIAYKFEKLIGTLDVNCSISKMSYLDQPYYLNERSGSGGSNHAKAILSTKNLKWAYEREWRLFAPQSGKIRYGASVVPTIFLGMRIDKGIRKSISDRLSRRGITAKIISANGYSLRDEIL
jgi:hypothetical protein